MTVNLNLLMRSTFAFSPLRMPSQADAPVSHQDPQSDGQKSPEPYILVTATTTHQELPASPKLTTFSTFPASTEIIQAKP